jgi:hypothetical protein
VVTVGLLVGWTNLPEFTLPSFTFLGGDSIALLVVVVVEAIAVLVDAVATHVLVIGRNRPVPSSGTATDVRAVDNRGSQ